MSTNLAKCILCLAFLAFAAAGLTLHWNVWWAISAFLAALVVLS